MAKKEEKISIWYVVDVQDSYNYYVTSYDTKEQAMKAICESHKTSAYVEKKKFMLMKNIPYTVDVKVDVEVKTDG